MPTTVLCRKCGASFNMRNVPEPDLSMLRSLYVPNNIEVSTIVNMVSDADRDIARYDEEIRRLEGLLNELKEQRKELKCHREKTHTLLSPVRKLPVEVLEQVFDIACRSKFGIEVTQKSADPLTLNLSQVCSVWRDIIRSKPALWSAMCIDLSHRNRARRVIGHYIEQAQGVPWTLFITTSSRGLQASLLFPDDDEFSNIHEWCAPRLSMLSRDMLADLLRFSKYWKDLTMNLPWQVMLDIEGLCDFSFSDYDLLESVTLQWDETRYRYPHQPPNAFMANFSTQQAPKLRHLSVPDFHPWFGFAFEQLRSFGTLDRWKNSSILGLLPLCHNVDSFTIIPRIRSAAEESDALTVYPPVHMFARSLNIREDEPATVTVIRLLNSLVANRLQYLCIDGGFGGKAWEESFTAFLFRSQSPLKTLILKNSCIGSDQHLLRLLSYLSTLIHLELYCEGSGLSPTIASSLIEGMTAVYESPILPKLQQLDLNLIRQTTVQLPTISQILTMAESRTSSLRSLDLTVELQDAQKANWVMNSNSLSRIQRLKGDGMHVSIDVQAQI